MNILVPIDGSHNAQRAIEHVISTITAFKELPQILLLNVQSNVAVGNVKLFINNETIQDYHREQGMLALQSARAALDAAGLAYQYHISVGAPAEAIMQYTIEQSVDRIVMGRQGLGSVKSMLLGSVVLHVLRDVACPVLLIK